VSYFPQPPPGESKYAWDAWVEGARLREGLRLMISYLGHEDQDANHEWMVMKMKAIVAGEDVPANFEAVIESAPRRTS
jgi:hypothetical protein